MASLLFPSLPPAYVPTPGEEVLVRCSPGNELTRAVVLSVSACADARRMRIAFVWTESNPHLFTPAVAGVRASVRVWRDGRPVMVHPLPEQAPEAPSGRTAGRWAPNVTEGRTEVTADRITPQGERGSV